MEFQSDTTDRITACLHRQKKLTLGEVELLTAIQSKKMMNLSLLEEQELKKIERKLGLT